VAYDKGARVALSGVTLRIAEGQQVALVGPTGSGKSTVANLLMRFIEPDSGELTIGGTPLTTVAPDDWRTQVAWVPQNPHLFYGTVADNLRLARPEATGAEQIEAARAANAHEFIMALPQAYDTPIGEQGVRLSGGQRQRIAIARAFLKQAPILILDEATANLDMENEALIRAALARLTQGRTVLMIAHRLQMVQDVDQIVVLANGRVVEMGSPVELMRQTGRYRTLATAFDGGLA
jgi:ABC-type multidrug transport system fused ATPase/permease subunit